jgi:hypothetical protein
MRVRVPAEHTMSGTRPIATAVLISNTVKTARMG